jgi:hypothetical protein
MLLSSVSRHMAAAAIVVVVATALVAACDRGGPPIDDLERQLNIEPATVMDVDSTTKATVVEENRAVTFVVLTPAHFGGWEAHKWTTTVSTVANGTAGNAASDGYCYLFGAEQGPLKEVQADGLVKSAVVNPSIDGWVAVFPEPQPQATRHDPLAVSLVAADGRLLDTAEAHYPPWASCGMLGPTFRTSSETSPNTPASPERTSNDAAVSTH